MSDGRKFEFNWPFFGNRHIIDFLQTGILSRQLSHFYIFAGAPDLGKGTLAWQFAASILCRNFADGKGILPCGECFNCQELKKNSHSGLTYLEISEGKKNISVEQVRDFIHLMNLGSFGGDFKIGIIKSGEKLNLEAANALLKTLEEPKPGVTIILLTAALEQLPATIISRGQVLTFRPVAREQIHDYLIAEHKVARSAARSLAKIACGRPALAAKFATEPKYLIGRRKISAALIKIMSSGAGEKLQLGEKLLADLEAASERINFTEVLEIWQALARDLLLVRLGLEELAADEEIIAELKTINLSLQNLRELPEKIGQGMKYYAANVSPKMVVENISLQI